LVAWYAFWPRPAPASDPVPEPPAFALEFDGSGRVEVPPLPLDLSRPFTLEAWATPTALSPKRGVILGNAGPNPTDVPRNLCLEISSYRRPPTYLYAWRFPANLGTKRAAAGERVHLAAVHEGGRVRFFVDGALNEMKDGVALAPQPGVAFWLGFDFRGRLDYVRISQAARYRVDFAPARIAEADEVTLALYAFKKESGGTLPDSSGRGRHGKIIGATWVRLRD
ncbi:MAG: LamG domain-containing protein, partial [Gemmataceae bacterium]|nr:LamG domain-containing protein [Gemmataceae bacterium]